MYSSAFKYSKQSYAAAAIRSYLSAEGHCLFPFYYRDIHFCWRGNLLSCHHSQWITMKNIKLQQTTRTLPGFTRRCPESRNLMNSTDDLFHWKHKSLSLFWYVFQYANVRMFCGACKVFTSLTFLLITEEFYFGQRKKNAFQIDYICMF